MITEKILGVAILVLIITNVINAQTKKIYEGVLFEKGTKSRLDSVKIINKQSREAVISNSWGLFNITTTKGDTLELLKSGYEIKNIIITDSNSKILYLIPFTGLKEVVIFGSSIKNDLLETQRAFKSKGVFYTGAPHYYYLFLKPMTFIYENFKSEVKSARKFKKFAKSELDYQETATRFTVALIKKHVPLTDGETTDFRLKYWPDNEQIKTWSDYDLISYIKLSYKDFKKDDK